MLRLSICGLILLCLLTPARASEDLIATVKIREKCVEFDRRSRGATRQTRVVFGMSDEGSDITALTLRGQIRKYFVTHLGTMRREEETIYLENGAPIWVTRVESRYDAPLSGRVVERITEWLFFQDGKLIQRDLMPVSIAGGVNRLDKPWIHQTSIASPAQAREWKAMAREWQKKVAGYRRALKAKP